MIYTIKTIFGGDFVTQFQIIIRENNQETSFYGIKLFASISTHRYICWYINILGNVYHIRFCLGRLLMQHLLRNLNKFVEQINARQLAFCGC